MLKRDRMEASLLIDHKVNGFEFRLQAAFLLTTSRLKAGLKTFMQNFSVILIAYLIKFYYLFN